MAGPQKKGLFCGFPYDSFQPFSWTKFRVFVAFILLSLLAIISLLSTIKVMLIHAQVYHITNIQLARTKDNLKRVGWTSFIILDYTALSECRKIEILEDLLSFLRNYEICTAFVLTQNLFFLWVSLTAVKKKSISQWNRIYTLSVWCWWHQKFAFQLFFLQCMIPFDIFLLG